MEDKMQEDLAKKVEAEHKQYREFTVTPGVTGFKVKIGCSEVYFGSAAELRNGIVSYLDNPQRTERDFLKQDIRINSTIPVPTAVRMNAGSGLVLAQQERNL